jgi:hypothetical protein
MIYIYIYILYNIIYYISGVNSSCAPGYFIHIPITTLIVSALKNYYIYRAFQKFKRVF